MIRLAYCPDNLILNLVQKAKIELKLITKPPPSPPMSPSFQFNPLGQYCIHKDPFRLHQLYKSHPQPLIGIHHYAIQTWFLMILGIKIMIIL